jgi:hypothetical protein
MLACASPDDALAHGAVLAEKDRARSEWRGHEGITAIVVVGSVELLEVF